MTEENNSIASEVKEVSEATEKIEQLDFSNITNITSILENVSLKSVPISATMYVTDFQVTSNISKFCSRLLNRIFQSLEQ